MFGFSFGELVVLIIVAIVVIGPKDLPKVLRKVGQWAGKLRRMAAELRAQSGIDDVLRSEGLSEDIAEIRKLARGELDNVVRSARIDTRPEDPYTTPAVAPGHEDGFPIDREREFPKDGADSYRALPDTAIVYAESLPASPHAMDPLYVVGDANGALPMKTLPLPVTEGPDGEVVPVPPGASSASSQPAAATAPVPAPAGSSPALAVVSPTPSSSPSTPGNA